MAGESEPPGMGEALAVTQKQVWGAGQRRQRAQRRGDFAKRQQPRHVGEAGRPPRQADSTSCRSPQRSTATAARVMRPRSSNPTSMPATRAGVPRRSRVSAWLDRRSCRARLAWAQIPAAGPDGDQRHGRRSAASLITRTVSDHRSSASISASPNQRASAASVPGCRSRLAASATKSIRV